ncbi:Cold-regulated 413 inner membrane protein 2 chloroplastic [Zea mays]|uniref:Cold-regulated 413 inner membrane protein 2 chloroplastic n=2 Tax=Zea mays TaxID=4577 RepID=A0A1D6F258_MAIZE|nr:Cold-regulated 413 inner membrane protein 2 chloroplastic [Zea mays]
MSISMRLAIPAPAVTDAAPTRLRVRVAATGNDGSLPVARAAVQAETGALRRAFLQGMRLAAIEAAGSGPAVPEQGGAVVCHSSAHLSVRTIQWISARTIAVLLVAKGTAIHKSFLVPFFALQTPCCIISWIKGDYGQWTAFLSLLVRLFFFIPGELELPLSTMLLVSVAPYQFMDLRGTQGGVVMSLVIAAYLAFQHFTRVGGPGKAFEQGSIVATLAIICIMIVPLMLLF